MKAREVIAALARGIEESGNDDVECQCCNWAGDLDYVEGVALEDGKLTVTTDMSSYE